LYPSIGEPPSNGASQSISTLFPFTVVVGASGLSGVYAARISTSLE
jgi:hypothetical protein